jgi:hypothetical protein
VKDKRKTLISAVFILVLTVLSLMLVGLIVSSTVMPLCVI